MLVPARHVAVVLADVHRSKPSQMRHEPQRRPDRSPRRVRAVLVVAVLAALAAVAVGLSDATGTSLDTRGSPASTVSRPAAGWVQTCTEVGWGFRHGFMDVVCGAVVDMLWALLGTLLSVRVYLI